MNSWRTAMHLYDNNRIMSDLKLRRKFTSQAISALQIKKIKLSESIKVYPLCNNVI